MDKKEKNQTVSTLNVRTRRQQRICFCLGGIKNNCGNNTINIYSPNRLSYLKLKLMMRRKMLTLECDKGQE